MREPPPTSIILAASSGIGAAHALRWRRQGQRVVGTYRRRNAQVEALEAAGVELVPCDLDDAASVKRTLEELRRRVPAWDALVLAPGRLEPIGPFADLDFAEWERSFALNCTAQLRFLHGLLPARRPSEASALLYAGGGTNGAVPNFSAYTLAKIALIKAVELLAAEMPDLRCVIVGPGWVDTPIHQETLAAKDRAGEAYQRTQQKLNEGDFTPMDRVLDCCDWLLKQPLELVSGRNFSVVWDRWGCPELLEELRRDPDLYMLRRSGNDRLPRAPQGVIS